MEQTKTVRTDDVFAAAYLMAMGARMARVVPGRFVRWEFFDDDGTATELKEAFASGEPVPCDAHILFDCHALLRRHIVTYKREAVRS